MLENYAFEFITTSLSVLLLFMIMYMHYQQEVQSKLHHMSASQDHADMELLCHWIGIISSAHSNNKNSCHTALHVPV
jgi:hypothetical protein